MEQLTAHLLIQAKLLMIVLGQFYHPIEQISDRNLLKFDNLFYFIEYFFLRWQNRIHQPNVVWHWNIRHG